MTDKTIRLILGNQLFPIQLQNIEEDETVFMCEDYGLCTRYISQNLERLFLCENQRRYSQEWTVQSWWKGERSFFPFA